MFYGVQEFVTLAAALGFVLHLFCDHYVACCIGGGIASSLVNLLHESWVANWQVNPGWFFPMLILGIAVAVPVIAVAEVPVVAVRSLWRWCEARRRQ